MTYSAIYCALITKRLEHPLSRQDCYVEKHHIIPRSEGGSDAEDNLVNLTAREHYVAHLLLAKIYKDYKMYSAITYMQTARHEGREFKFNSYLYEKLREEFGRKSSEMQKGKKPRWEMTPEIRAKMSAWQKGKPKSAQAREHMSEAKKGKPIAHFTKEFRSDCTSNKNKGRHWFTDGEINVFRHECPDGFHRGLSSKTRKKMSKSSKRIGFRGKHSEESKRKMSESHKARFSKRLQSL